jgi:tetratricopeptide (TPR) repeat protein
MPRFRCLLLVLALAASPVLASAAEPPGLVKARASYNAAEYDAAIDAASEVLRQPQWADAAALVLGRAHLERYRVRGNPTDLILAHGALTAVRAPALSDRDFADLLVGLGQYLYLIDAFGTAAEVFDSALAQSLVLTDRERLLLLDWWANALDRSAQARPAVGRGAVFARLIARMEEALRRDPASPVANYWLAVAARGVGDIERAWEASTAGWVRAGLVPDAADAVRADIDRFVVQVLVPERVRARGGRDPQEALVAMLAEWETFKDQWP